MPSYALHQPESLAEALDLLAAHGDEDTHLIAGGTSMVLLMTMGLVQPEHVIALRKIPELHGITPDHAGGPLRAILPTERQICRYLNNMRTGVCSSIVHTTTKKKTGSPG